jgi:hypothetical protein
MIGWCPYLLASSSSWQYLVMVSSWSMDYSIRCDIDRNNWNSSVVPMVLIKHNVTATAALGCVVVVAGCVSLFAVVVFVITIWLLS